MPLKKCSNNGESGYKWGDSGKCYTGPGAKDKALKQGRAIETNKNKATSLVDKVREILDKKHADATQYEYEDPRTGEVFTFNRRGGHTKDGRMLVFKREIKD